MLRASTDRPSRLSKLWVRRIVDPVTERYRAGAQADGRHPVATISELDTLPTISQVKSPGPSKPRAAGSADSVPNAMIASNPADGEAGRGSPYRGPSRSRLFYPDLSEKLP